ncbi:MAG: DNA/RNA non-specific endonuclease [Prevotella sp.]|nr:DNA/RNA non-specific endonuclease [Prevotella sp.]
MKLFPRLLLAALLLVPLLTACEDDDKLPKANDNGLSDAENTNRNTADPTSDYARLELPHLKGDAQSVVLVRRVPNFGINYIIEYDTQKRSQRWTAWQWYSGNSGTPWNRNNWDKQTDNPWAMRNLREYGWGDPFQPDPDLPVGVRTELEDYYDSGYQRGHICASADRLNSKDANEQTFYLSNIMPQTSQLNNGIWQDMENHVRNKWNNNDFRRVLYVVKGGTIADDALLGYTSSGLPIPKYFFMALLCESDQGQYKALAFVVEHSARNQGGTPLRNYVVNIDELESLTGIDFFCNLPDATERKVESALKSDIVKEWKL